MSKNDLTLECFLDDAKNDIQQVTKYFLDVLPEKMDSEGKNDGLEIIQKDYDHLVYEIKSTKKIVYKENEEGIYIIISQWTKS